MGEKRGMKALEAWCRRVTDGYRDVKIDNMSSSWRDGLAFCALIHHFRPDLIDFDALSKENILQNNELAFSIAEKHLGIPALLEAEDMVNYKVPDKLSIMTYVSQFYQFFQGSGHAVSPSRTSKRPLDSNGSSSTTTSPDSPPGKITPLGTPPSLPRHDVCQACHHRVFILERLIIDSKLYHRTCFKCSRCATVLKPASYVEGRQPGQYECVSCPDEEEAEKAAIASMAAARIAHQLSPTEEWRPLRPRQSIRLESLRLSSSVAQARMAFLRDDLVSSEEKVKSPEQRMDLDESDSSKNVKNSKVLLQGSGEIDNVLNRGKGDDGSKMDEEMKKSDVKKESLIAINSAKVLPVPSPRVRRKRKSSSSPGPRVGSEVVDGGCDDVFVTPMSSPLPSHRNALNKNNNNNNINNKIDKSSPVPSLSTDEDKLEASSTAQEGNGGSPNGRKPVASVRMSRSIDRGLDALSSPSRVGVVMFNMPVIQSPNVPEKLSPTLLSKTGQHTVSAGNLFSEPPPKPRRSSSGSADTTTAASTNIVAVKDTTPTPRRRVSLDNKLAEKETVGLKKDGSTSMSVLSVGTCSPTVKPRMIVSLSIEDGKRSPGGLSGQPLGTRSPLNLKSENGFGNKPSAAAQFGAAAVARSISLSPKKATSPDNVGKTVSVDQIGTSFPFKLLPTTPKSETATGSDRPDAKSPPLSAKMKSWSPNKVEESTTPMKSEIFIARKVYIEGDEPDGNLENDISLEKMDNTKVSPPDSQVGGDIAVKMTSVRGESQTSLQGAAKLSPLPSPKLGNVDVGLSKSTREKLGGSRSPVSPLSSAESTPTKKVPPPRPQLPAGVKPSPRTSILKDEEKVELKRVQEEEYPDDLNPFNEEEEDEAGLKSEKSLNPFDSESDGEDDGQTTNRSSDDFHTPEGKPSPLLETKSEPRLRMKREAPPGSNPFGSDEDEDEEEAASVVLRATSATDHTPSLLNDTRPTPLPRRSLESRSTSVSPAGSLSKSTGPKYMGSYSANTSPSGSVSKASGSKYSTYSSSNLMYSDRKASRDSGLDISPTGSLSRTYRKKRQAPKPPVPVVPPLPALEKLNLEESSPRLEHKVSMRQKKSPAPPPPSVRPSIVVQRNSASPTSDSEVSEKTLKELDNLTLKSSGSDTAGNEQLSSPSPGQGDDLVSPTSTTSINSRNTFGFWKKKKPAPPVPLPPKRQITKLPIEEIQRELAEIEVKQEQMETRGIELETKIREGFADESDESGENEDVLLLQLFDLVNQKNVLFRRQAELVYLRRQQRLEEEHAELEFQIRCIMGKPDTVKTDEDRELEDELIQRLMEIVEQRNEIIESMETDRLREAIEDKSIKAQMATHHGMENVSASSSRSAISSGSSNSLELQTKRDKKQQKKEKEKEKEKKLTLKKSTKSKEKEKSKCVDEDKDLDEVETAALGKNKKEKKRKWF